MAWLLYCAVFPNGKRYFGVTQQGVVARERDHRKSARRGSHLPVHQAIRRFGEDCVFQTIVVGEKDYILDLEMRAIASFETQDRRYGYNVTAGGEVNPMLSAEVRAKHAASVSAFKGVKKSAEARAKMSAAQKGKKRDPSAVERGHAKLRGRKQSPEFCARVSAFHKGRPHSPEQIAKFIVSRTGVKHSDETKARMSAVHTGTKRSEETKAKMSAKLIGNSRAKGFKHSPETIAKRLATIKRKREQSDANPRLHDRLNGNT